MTYESEIASVWPFVARVARAELRRFRLPPEVVEDLLQDAAAIVMRRRPDFASSDELAPYVRIVVRRLAYRWLRRQSREVVGAVPERPVLHSVADLAEHRLKLRGTAHAFAALPAQDRRRLHDYLSSEVRTGDARERARERKQIERIRLAMNRVAEGLAAAFGWVRMRLRWLEASPTQMTGMALAVTGLVAAVLPYFGTTAGGSSTLAGSIAIVAAGPSGAAAPVARPTQAFAPVPAPKAVGTARRSPAPTTRPPRDVVRITTPTGDDAGWRKRDNPTGNALVCVNVDAVWHQCVDSVPIPRPGL